MTPTAGTVAVFAGIVSADDALFFVHCDTRKVAHMLVGAGELVEPASSCRSSGCRRVQIPLFRLPVRRFQRNFPRVVQAQRKLIAAQAQLDGVAHWGYLLHGHLCFRR